MRFPVYLALGLGASCRASPETADYFLDTPEVLPAGGFCHQFHGREACCSAEYALAVESKVRGLQHRAEALRGPCVDALFRLYTGAACSLCATDSDLDRDGQTALEKAPQGVGAMWVLHVAEENCDFVWQACEAMVPHMEQQAFCTHVQRLGSPGFFDTLAPGKLQDALEKGPKVVFEHKHALHQAPHVHLEPVRSVVYEHKKPWSARPAAEHEDAFAEHEDASLPSLPALPSVVHEHVHEHEHREHQEHHRETEVDAPLTGVRLALAQAFGPKPHQHGLLNRGRAARLRGADSVASSASAAQPENSTEPDTEPELEPVAADAAAEPAAAEPAAGDTAAEPSSAEPSAAEPAEATPPPTAEAASSDAASDAASTDDDADADDDDEPDGGNSTNGTEADALKAKVSRVEAELQRREEQLARRNHSNATCGGLCSLPVPLLAFAEDASLSAVDEGDFAGYDWPSVNSAAAAALVLVAVF